MGLIGWQSAVLIVISFLLTAALVRPAIPRVRRRLRRAAFFSLAYLLALATVYLGAYLPYEQVVPVATNVAGILGWIAIIEISAVAIFKLIFPRLGIDLPSIVDDLSIGAALFILVVAGLRQFGVDPASIVTTSAVVTGILALSLQTTLGNVIGGVALQLDRSIRVGDWIQLENGRQGLVREIHWRHTVIETRDWDTIIVPNSSLLAANIIILGKRDGEVLQHRMWVYFNVDFRYRPSFVIRTAEEAIQAAPPIRGVAEHPLPNCVCLDFAKDQRESYSVYAVRYWLTIIAEDDPTSSRVRQRLFAALKRAGIPLAIPAAQLFVDQDSAERRIQKHKSDVDARLLALGNIDFLNLLDADELEFVAAGLQPGQFSAGENITVQGREAHWLYILTEGTADVLITEGNQEQMVASLEAPTIVGEMGLMTGEPRSATVVATSPVHTYRLFRDNFQQILSDRPQLMEAISRVLATRDVELRSAREQLDVHAKEAQIDDASTHLLGKISEFFGLSKE
jgi:small-conductance mechanosensitive channel/CRP-like cAMP-binding protein